MSTVISDTSPADLLACVRGTVAHARITASRRIELTVADPSGGRWRLVSWEATCSASDPGRLKGKSIVNTELDAESGALTMGFSNGSQVTLVSTRRDDDDAVEDWELFTPDGLVLAYGPKGQWQLGEGNGKDLPPRPTRSPMDPIRDSRQWKQACREIGLNDDERELASNDLDAHHVAMEGR